jgi:hypothetical protein
MNWVRLKRSVLWLVVVWALVVTTLGSSMSLTACGDSSQCTKTRDDTFAQLQSWSNCDPNDPTSCIIVPGNARDCSGVLTCDFAVNRLNRVAAEQATLTIANKTQGCYLCATPNCVNGDIPYCDPESRQCIVVTALIDGSPQFSFDGNFIQPEAGPVPEASPSDGASE